jgi:hypothetical protein
MCSNNIIAIVFNILLGKTVDLKGGYNTNLKLPSDQEGG